MTEQGNIIENPMGTKPVPRLLLSMGIPAGIANLVNAMYNVVDQIFIGNTIGYLGNAATNITYPLTTICLAVGLLIGLGAATGFNLKLGEKRPEEARKIAGSAFSFLLLCGILVSVFVLLFLKPLMILFGATDNILDYAKEYSAITAISIPFLIFSTGANPLIREDGSPTFSMLAIVSGAVTNVLLDALFMYGLDLGIAGAAWATVIGQTVSAVLLLSYIRKFQNVTFLSSDFIPKPKYILESCKLGLTPFILQFSMMIVQIAGNNLLRKYGAQSVYGSDVPIAVAGILSKINSITFAVVLGVVQGAQPICSFNYGAKKYFRVRETVKWMLVAVTILSTIIFILIQSFPKQIIGFFGKGDDSYFEFAIKYARGFTACMFLNGIQQSVSPFFTSIGKVGKGTVNNILKQFVLFVPLLFLLSYFWGLDGIIMTFPITDGAAFMIAATLLFFEMKNMSKTDVT